MICMLMFISGAIAFMFGYKHTLSMLLSLEFMVLSLLLMFIDVVTMVGEEYFVMYFLVFAACEGALGLSIIVALIRTHGSDFFLSFNIIQC